MNGSTRSEADVGRVAVVSTKESFSEVTIGTSREKARCKCPLPGMPTVSAFCTDINRVVKIACSSSEVVLQNTKHTMIYPGSGSFSEVVPRLAA
jgi:hypothetical protein